MAIELTLSSQVGKAPTNQSTINALDEQPMLDYTKTVSKHANGSKDTFDGYEFKTDWNGSSDVISQPTGNIFATNFSNGLRFVTNTTIGKDRDYYYQFWGRGDSNLWLANVIGFTGLWQQDNRQYHPRLEMVCFHYMDSSGNRTIDYRPTQILRGFSESNHYWEYGNGGQHDSGSQWYIGYQLNSAARRQFIFDGDHLLFGMSLQIKFRTAAGSRTADGRFWNFKPIIAKDGGAAELADASTCQQGKRLVIPVTGNTYPKSGDMKLS